MSLFALIRGRLLLIPFGRLRRSSAQSRQQIRNFGLFTFLAFFFIAAAAGRISGGPAAAAGSVGRFRFSTPFSLKGVRVEGDFFLVLMNESGIEDIFFRFPSGIFRTPAFPFDQILGSAFFEPLPGDGLGGEHLISQFGIVHLFWNKKEKVNSCKKCGFFPRCLPFFRRL